MKGKWEHFEGRGGENFCLMEGEMGTFWTEGEMGTLWKEGN